MEMRKGMLPKAAGTLLVLVQQYVSSAFFRKSDF
jgi:hypothetical protein